MSAFHVPPHSHAGGGGGGVAMDTSSDAASAGHAHYVRQLGMPREAAPAGGGAAGIFSPDLAIAQNFCDTLSGTMQQKEHERAQQEAAAAAAAAVAAATAAQGTFLQHKAKATPGVAENAASLPFSFIDQYCAQSAIQRLFFDSIDRVRKANMSLRPEQAKIPQEELVLLNSLFPKDLHNALTIIDEDKIQTFVGEGSKRVFWRVSGSSSSSSYTTTQFHCDCPSFHNSVVIGNDKLYCKHQIAAMLGDALNRQGQVQLVSDTQLGLMLVPVESKLGQKPFQHRGGGGWRGGGGGGGGGSGH